GDAGLRVLADSALLPRLEVLRLRGNYLGREGLRALAMSPGVARLRVLDVSGNALGGEAVEALLESPHLIPGTRISFQRNGVSTKFMETLRRKHAGRLILD